MGFGAGTVLWSVSLETCPLEPPGILSILKSWV